MAVEPLEFGEEMRIRKVAIDDADRIVRIKCNLQIAADGFHGLHVARRNVAGGADQRKARHHLSPSPMSSDFRFTKATAVRVKSPHPASLDIQVALRRRQAAATESASSSTRTFRPSKSRRTDTRSVSFMPSNKPDAVGKGAVEETNPVARRKARPRGKTNDSMFVFAAAQLIDDIVGNRRRIVAVAHKLA